MENASKALLMAGGILISIVVIGLFAYMFTYISSSYESREVVKKTEEIVTFNKKFESYNKKLLRGTDVISLMNRVISNNEKYEGIEEYQITIAFILEDDLAAYKWVNKVVANGTVEKVAVADPANSLKKGIEYKVNKKTSNGYKILYDKTLTTTETFNDFKRRIFDCTKVTYDDKNVNKTMSGRIKSMTFKERKSYLMEGF